jgi:hypothetical protein
LQIHEESDDGDILVFLPGQEEIEDLASLLKKHLEADKELARSLTGDIVQNLHGIGTDLSGKTATIVNGVMICVLYAALPPEAQMMAFAPKPEGCTRKIILATNIAETSVTLSGIRYVVDCGKHKTRDYNGTTGMESLTVNDISKAQVGHIDYTFIFLFCFCLLTRGTPHYTSLWYRPLNEPDVLAVCQREFVSAYILKMLLIQWTKPQYQRF